MSEVLNECSVKSFKKYDISNFTNFEQIGSGGYGEVNKAYSASDGINVVIKHVLSTKHSIYDTIIKELVYLTHLNKYSNNRYVAKLYGYYVHENKLYLVLEQLYTTLYKRYTGPESVRVKLTQTMYNDMIYELLSILNFIHSYGIVHNDFKLGNIMLENISEPDSKFKIKVIDFGLASFLGISPFITNFSKYISTDYIMAPEGKQILDSIPGTRASYQSDIYSLGQCIIALLLHSERNRGIIIDNKLYWYDIKEYNSNTISKDSLKIKPNNELNSNFINGRLGENGYNLLLKMLNPDSSSRSSAKELLNDGYFVRPKTIYYYEEPINTQSGGITIENYIYANAEIINKSYELQYKDDIHENYKNNEYCIHIDTNIQNYNKNMYSVLVMQHMMRTERYIFHSFDYDAIINIIYNYRNLFDILNKPNTGFITRLFVDIYNITYMHIFFSNMIDYSDTYLDIVLNKININNVINPFITHIHYILLDFQKDNIYSVDVIFNIEDFILTGIYTFTIIPYSEIDLKTTVWNLIIFFTLKAISVISKRDILIVLNNPPLEYLKIDIELYNTLNTLLNKKLTVYKQLNEKHNRNEINRSDLFDESKYH